MLDAPNKLGGPISGGDDTENLAEFEKINERINKLFNQAGHERAVTADLSELYL